MRHVAIVGCGFTGTSAFFQLVDRYPVREISIFEKSSRFGPFLINTTGSVDRRVRSADQPPLIKALVAQGLLRPYSRDGQELGGGRRYENLSRHRFAPYLHG
jgi:uncharacterized NAD(P)/FAD-binding protein YdhS